MKILIASLLLLTSACATIQPGNPTKYYCVQVVDDDNLACISVPQGRVLDKARCSPLIPEQPTKGGKPAFTCWQ